MDTVLFAIWFFLPAGAANAAPIIAAKLPYLSRLNSPLDFGKEYKDIRVLGANKTWRGLITGILVAACVVYVQQLISQHSYVEFIPVQFEGYLFYSPLLLGFLFGFGALAGDAVESFFKRQKRVPPGKAWFPFDQLDYIVGGCLFAAVIVRLGILEYVSIFVFWFLMHIVFSYIGYLLTLKKAPI